MVTINNVCSFPVLIIENKGKTQKVNKELSMRKIYKNMHMPQFFQTMLYSSSKFLHKKGVSPCAGKHSWTILVAAQIKEERFKSFF